MADQRVPAGVPTGGQFAAAMRAEAAALLPERTVHVMDAAEFAAKFPPMLWGGSWEELDEAADEDVEEPTDEDEWEAMGAHFSWGGEHGWTVDDLVPELRRDGMLNPVEIFQGQVSEGHHRVVAALRAGVDIRYVHIDNEPDDA